MLDKYDDLYSLDLFGETIEGHRNINPYNWNPIEGKIILNRHVDGKNIKFKAAMKFIDNPTKATQVS